MKRDEQNAISRFIEDNGLIVVSELPNSAPFPDKVFYKTPEGLYLRIESRGTPVDFSAPPDDVFVRFIGITYFMSGSDEVVNDRRLTWDFQFNNPYSFYESTFISQGVIIPLQEKYGLGNEGTVSMIIPSNLGTSDQQTYIYPVFIRGLQYTVSDRKRP